MAFPKKALAVESLIGLAVGFLAGYIVASGLTGLSIGLRFLNHLIWF